MTLYSQIPNLLTLSNLICGILSIYAIQLGYEAEAAYLILLAAGFDFFDGLAARALGVSGELGKQLDSLADVVSFGVAPVFIALHLTGALHGGYMGWTEMWWPLLPVVMGAMAAYRLAVFNIDTRQSDSFIGMPTPSVALWWVAMLLIAAAPEGTAFLDRWYGTYLDSVHAIVFSALFFAAMMVAPLPLIALKFKNWGWAGNAYRYVLVVSALVLLAIFAVKAIPIILLLYIALSVMQNLRKPTHGIQSSN